ncbi:MAG: hypothetical protein HPY53_11640 [Brevinematales bacterium]|nr:hypothetical protein [Brevinematales bacterium]
MKRSWVIFAVAGIFMLTISACGNSGAQTAGSNSGVQQSANIAQDEPDWKGRLQKMEALMTEYVKVKAEADSGDADAKAKCGEMEAELRGMEMELGYLAPQLPEKSKAEFKKWYDKIMAMAEIPEMSYGE